MTPYQEFILTRSYARWSEEHNRRELWPEPVERYRKFFQPLVPPHLHTEFVEAMANIVKFNVMPSMRALWTAGPALERDNICGYNCAYTPIDSPRAFAELLYVLLNGTGIGFSVESNYIDQLPVVPGLFSPSERVIQVADSKRGWAEGLLKWVRALYNGEVPTYDLSKVRPKGAILKTFGGRASGPEPLDRLFKFVKNTLMDASGRRITALEAHDICCMCAETVVVGGVRRSALISLGDLTDDELSTAKYGQNFPFYRHNANNSAVYTRRPSFGQFNKEWFNLYTSKSGERGIFNRQAADFAVAATGRREVGHTWGINPCGEIILRPYELCNLTEVVVRSTDSLDELLNKVRFATLLGVLQSTLTKFNFVNSMWRKNCEEERLLGVSLTGIMDHPILSTVSQTAKTWLSTMRETSIRTAKKWSEALGIAMPKGITCVKPSGTVSQLVDSSSGIHPRFSPFYIRRVEVSSTDPLAHMMIDTGVPCVRNPSGDGWKFEFPVASPSTSKTTSQVTAIQQLEVWLMLKKYWCEHNPSCSIYIREDEWAEVQAWVYRNWNSVCGLAFFPKDEHAYELPPFEEIDEDTFRRSVDKFPTVNFSLLSQYEKSDQTSGARELACTSATGCTI